MTLELLEHELVLLNHHLEILRLLEYGLLRHSGLLLELFKGEALLFWLLHLLQLLLQLVIEFCWLLDLINQLYILFFFLSAALLSTFLHFNLIWHR